MAAQAAGGRVKARIDLHCHSEFSRDALGTLDDIATAAMGKGLHGVALTDHDTVAHHAAIRAWNAAHPDAGFRFFEGCEVSARGGHLLAFGLQEALPPGLPMADVIDRVAAQGGVVVPSHPFRLGTGIGDERLDAHSDGLPAVEVWNAQELGNGNRDAATWAVANGKGGTGGSDAHQVHDAGNGYTEFLEPVDSLEALITALQAGHTWGVGRRTAFRTLARQATRNLWRRARGRL